MAGSRSTSRPLNGTKPKLTQVFKARELAGLDPKTSSFPSLAPKTPAPKATGSKSPRIARKPALPKQELQAVPDLRAIVERMAAVGDDLADIARLVGLPLSVLRERYQAELEQAPLRANLRVKENLLLACCGDVTKPATISAIAWWTKNRCGWTERVEANLHLVRSLDDMSDDELLKIAARGRDDPAT